ncbi:hypothetical protein [Streptococcus cuniculi]|uniref:hypothetical protein n=1 Tax=Streptococcus cuniculi TaxID=1432788 RepID=UPI001430737B|nr:hypothetical protein [Streptococcus cuniculi]MBF0777476.1 hypothetical protein [Streptococcus cuniculi]
MKKPKSLATKIQLLERFIIPVFQFGKQPTDCYYSLSKYYLKEGHYSRSKGAN